MKLSGENLYAGLEDPVRRALKQIIAAQSFGLLITHLFSNGFMLMYLDRLGVSSSGILILLALPGIMSTLLILPFAFYSDRRGKKKTGLAGLLVMLCAGAGLAGVPLLPSAWRGTSLMLCAALFGVGIALFTSSWFALISPLVPENIRGRYFGRLRLSWQLVGIIFSFAVMALLNHFSGLWIFQTILLVALAGSSIRVVLYNRIPELEPCRPVKLRESVQTILRLPGFMSFNAYVFILTLFTGTCPWLFGLLQKDVLHFSERDIVLMGNLLMVGSLIGFYVGGRMVDRHGTKPVFLFAHLLYAAILFLIPLRTIVPADTTAYIGALVALFGLVSAASGIAITSETMALIPSGNKSMAIALNLALGTAAVSVMSILMAQTLKLGVVSERWEVAGLVFSSYDTLLMACGVMVLLMAVTLGLIPSMIRQARHIPQA